MRRIVRDGQEPQREGRWSDYGTGTTAFFEATITAGRSPGSAVSGYAGYHNRNRQQYGRMSPNQMSA